jgi:mannose-1-phosphate guanylyltransferase
VQALILAGGEGTRLRPLTHTVPKPVLPLAGRPHIAYVIDWLLGHGADDVVVSCGFLAEGMRKTLAAVQPGLEIRYAEEPDARGTAGAIRFAEEMLGDRFLVLNGDILCNLDLGALIEQHERTGAQATIALYPVEDPSGYGLIHRRDDGEITEFLEKPEPDQIDTDEINAGAYLLERSVLERIPPDRAVSIETEVFPQLIGEGLYGIRLDGYWIDIGTPERFLQANWDILESRVETVTTELIDDRGVLIGEGCDLGDDVTIGPAALLGDGVRISDGARIGPRAVIGPGCELGEGATVEESVMLAGCRVGEGATVSGSILSANVEVEANAVPEPGSVIGEDELVGVQ